MGRSVGRHAISTAEIEAEFVAAAKAVRGERRPAFFGKALEIVGCAHALFCEGGLESFSVRQVAERAGISLAALQYHFPSRAKLIAAMIDHRMNWYENELIVLLRGLAGRPEQALLNVVDWFLDDAASKGTTSFSLHFWALADYDEDARLSLDEYMRVYRAFLALLVRRVNPGLSKTEALMRGAMLTSLIDGTMPITGHGKPKHPEFRTLRMSIRRIALQIAQGR